MLLTWELLWLTILVTYLSMDSSVQVILCTASPHKGYITLGELNSVILNEDNNSICLLGFLWRLKELIYARRLEQCLPGIWSALRSVSYHYHDAHTWILNKLYPWNYGGLKYQNKVKMCLILFCWFRHWHVHNIAGLVLTANCVPKGVF